jgi:hypothetical protein
MNHFSKPQNPHFSDETLDAAFEELGDAQSDQPAADIYEVETVDLTNFFFSWGFNWRSML